MDWNQKHREVIDYLHAQEIGSYVELPQIAVMGDTSSGKSSLLSAISGVQFPASDELTTRCPTRLRMEKSKDSTSSASISIHWDAKSDYKNSTFQKVVLNGESQWDLIGNAISNAQKHIIASSQKEVAPDIVEVSVCSPDCVDVTLIDLPGIVRAVGAAEDKCIIDDIQNLLRSFLENPRCILLVVIPANVDFHNSQILQDALNVDPETRRTIPVITKPDRIDPGAESGVLDLFMGKKTATFSCGFHIVKCRGQEALNKGVTILQGLKNESQFFGSTKPWSEVKQRQFLGIPTCAMPWPPCK
jgi:GTPase SAR1 family protein